MLLPTAFRSLSRLSSALSAKASVLRPFLLDLTISSSVNRSLVLSNFRFSCFLAVYFHKLHLGCLKLFFRYLRFLFGSIFGFQCSLFMYVFIYVKGFRLITFLRSCGHLLSRAVSSEVPSAVWVLTVVFGMGTGVSPTRIDTRTVLQLIAHGLKWTRTTDLTLIRRAL